MALSENLELAIQYYKTNDMARAILMRALNTTDIPDDETVLREKLQKSPLPSSTSRRRESGIEVVVDERYDEYGICSYTSSIRNRFPLIIPDSIIREWMDNDYDNSIIDDYITNNIESDDVDTLDTDYDHYDSTETGNHEIYNFDDIITECRNRTDTLMEEEDDNS